MSTPNESRKGFTLHKAVVHSANAATGICQVKIPDLLGQAVVNVPATGLAKVGAAYKVPTAGDLRMVAVSNDTTQISWVVSADSTSIWNGIGTTGAGPTGPTGPAGIVFSPTAPSTTVLWADTSATGNNLEHICTSSTRPSAPYFGMCIAETDTLRYLRYDGTGWIITGEPLQSFTPTVTAATGSFTTLGTRTFQYQRHDGWLKFALSFNIIANGTAAGAVYTTLPVGTAITILGHGRENAVTGKTLQVVSGGTGAAIFNYDNTYPGGTGAAIQANGQYLMSSVYS